MGRPPKYPIEFRREAVSLALSSLRSALFDYIEAFYNPQRIQRRLGHRSPAGYEEQSVA